LKILAVDTSSKLCSVAILEDKNLIKKLELDNGLTHSETLMPLIQQLLNECSLSLNNINLLVSDIGPGSFTGIRIGVSSCKAFSDSLNIPCVGISSLEVLAYNIQNDGIICSTIDCKNNNCYFALYELNSGNYNVLIEPCAKSVNDVLDLLNSQYYNKCISFVGDGIPSEKLHSIYDNNADSEVTKNIISSYLNVENLGTAGYKKFINNKKIGEEILPLYLKKPQAQIQLEEKLKAKI
jgi:universal bacterial protein yeaZ